jgi:pyrroloquinoline-quinone synthase
VTWSDAEFEAQLRRVLDERYHHRHPFNLRMHAGTLTPDEIRTWVRNRYYYQTRIPIKDGLILAKSGDPAFRRGWVRRIHDHDGETEGSGGLELWLRLAEAAGLAREEVASLRSVLPGVREACDDYVRFVDSHDLLESVASSLTEMAAGEIMKVRIAAFEKHYAWVEPEGLAYFVSRTRQAPADAKQGMAFVLANARTQAERERCVAALERKCEILWGLLDAIEAANSRPLVPAHVKVRKDPVGEGSLAVLPERAVRINETGREILSLCDGARAADAIAAEIARRHPDADGAAEQVHAFLDEMARLGVIERRPPA